MKESTVIGRSSVAPKTRLEWPDVAKGISILGVVLVHISAVVPESDATIFYVINRLLTPLRMPLFFLVSGYFSWKLLSFTFADLFKKRIWFFLVPYTVWAIVGLSTNYASKEGETTSLLAYVSVNTLLASNGQWFLHSLILFNVVLWLTRRLPSWAIVVVAVSPVLLLPAFNDVETVARTVMYLPVFLLGAYCRSLITRFAETAARFKVAALAAALYAFGLGLTVAWSLAYNAVEFEGSIGVLFDLIYYPLRSVAAVLCIPAGIALSVLVVKVGFLAKAFKFMGRHTLVIYLGHYFGLNVFGLLFTYEILTIDSQSGNPLYWSGTWVLVGVLAGMAGGYVFHLVSKVPVLGWTVVPPRITGQKAAPVKREKLFT